MAKFTAERAQTRLLLPRAPRVLDTSMLYARAKQPALVEPIGCVNQLQMPTCRMHEAAASASHKERRAKCSR
eukprot:6174310-Pleurochrysis_carterae.AAC.1